MDWTNCCHCSEPIITSHLDYKPRTKLIAVPNEAPKIAQYCSDACKEGFDISKTDSFQHPIKDMIITDSKYGRHFLCFECMKFYPVAMFKTVEAETKISKESA